MWFAVRFRRLCPCANWVNHQASLRFTWRCIMKFLVYMALVAFSNSITLLWPEGLMIAVAVLYLIGMKSLALDSPINSTRVRLLSIVGILATASGVLLVSMPSYYTILAIPVIPAPFAFGVLIFRPTLILKWTRLRVYLTVCVVVSALAWATQFVWLFTR
jgi:hypothetical protein